MVNILMIVALLTDLIHRRLIKNVQQDDEIQNFIVNLESLLAILLTNSTES
jgi:hypothetical protein